jgi:MFS family permease
VFLLGAAFVDMGPELGYGPTGLGLLTGTFFLTSALASAPLGRFVERVGWQTAMRINAVASGGVVVAIGLAARNVAALAALLVASAAVYGMANPAGNKALAAHGNPRHRALIFGLKHAGIPSSTLLAGLAVPALVVTAGWRAAYVAAGVVAVAVFLLVPRRAPQPSTHPEYVDVRRTVEVLDRRRLVALAASSALATWGPVALSTYLVAAAVDLGFSTSQAGLLLFGGSAVSILARVAAGAVTDRIGGRGFAGVATLAGVGAVLFLFVPRATGAAFAALVLAAFATGWGWPGLMTYAVVNANHGTVAASSAITQAGIFAGAGAGPLVMGWMVGRWGFDAGWFLAAGGLSVAAVAVATVGARVSASGRVAG